MKIRYFIGIIIIIILTALVSFGICNANYKNNEPLSEEKCIEFLESGTQMALNSVAAYRKQKMDYTLENYIKTIENAFSEDKDFIKLFKSNVEKLSELRENNLKTLYFDNTGSMAPMLYNGSAEGFEQAEINVLHEVVTTYCSNHQDYQPCIDVVFNRD